MKSLVVYYSRTGNTKKVGDEIAKLLEAEIEEISAASKYKGVIGYMKAGKEGMKKVLADITQTTKDPSEYDIVVIGTPVWAWNISSPVRAYLHKHKGAIKNVAVFATQGGSGAEKAIAEVEKILEKKAKSSIQLLAKEIHKELHIPKIREFVDALK